MSDTHPDDTPTPAEQNGPAEGHDARTDGVIPNAATESAPTSPPPASTPVAHAPTEQIVPERPPLPAAPTVPAHEYAGSFHTQPTQPYPAGGFAAPSAPVPTAGGADASGRVGAGKIVAIMVAAALVGGAAGLGAAAAGGSFLSAAGPAVVSTGPGTVTVNNSESVNQTTAIAAKVLPSVVTISASSSSSGGTGSGVVLSADGYVVTNTHVVTLDGATGDAAITVTTSDGKVYKASVVGTDPTYDLAVIKLEGATDLTPIELADSSSLNVGDQTVAVGAPLGLSNTVTTGIVSALNRSIQIASSAAPEGGDAEDQPGQGESPFQFDFGQGQQQQSATSSISIAVIQTDAAINPGNSGGALVDESGKLIGINVAIASTGGSSSSQAGSIGVGFSIPSNIVKRITDELIDNGEATHGLLGAMVGDAAARENATTAGAYISEVSSGGAAAEAGLKAGDVVTSFNGLPITDATDLTAQVRALAAGSTATVVYVRDGQTASAEVTLGKLTP
jgi:putative serine protease PepD